MEILNICSTHYKDDTHPGHHHWVWLPWQTWLPIHTFFPAKAKCSFRNLLTRAFQEATTNQSGSSLRSSLRSEGSESNPLCHVQKNVKSKGITRKSIQAWFWQPAHLSLELHACVIYNTWGWTKSGILTLEFSIIFKKFWCLSPNYWLGYFLGFLYHLRHW